MLTFLRGRIGPVEQQRPGRLGLLLLCLGLVIVLVLVVVGAINS